MQKGSTNTAETKAKIGASQKRRWAIRKGEETPPAKEAPPLDTEAGMAFAIRSAAQKRRAARVREVLKIIDGAD